MKLQHLPPGPYGVEVHKPRAHRGADVVATGVAVTLAGVPLARMALDNVGDLQAIAAARLFATSPKLLAALELVDNVLAGDGLPASHPARVAARDAITLATLVPLSCL